MSIENRCGRDQQINGFPASQAEAHTLIALEQAALDAARLAIARWSNSSSDPALLAAAMLESTSSKAIWYAQAQQNFQEWLGRGGFAQYDLPSAEPGGATLATDQDAGTTKPLASSAARPTKICAN